MSAPDGMQRTTRSGRLVRAGAIGLSMFGLGLVLRLVGPDSWRPSSDVLWAYAAVAGLSLVVLVTGIRLSRRRE